MDDHGRIPIWFFIGVLLTAYGVLILGAGLWELSHPVPIVLGQLHLAIWWGILLLSIGVFYVLRFNPRR